MSEADRVRVLLDLGRDHEAAQAAQEGLTAKPENVELLLLLSRALLTVDPDRCVGPAMRAVGLRPSDPGALIGLAVAQGRAGNLLDALRAAEAARDLAPGLTGPYMVRASILTTNARNVGRRAGRTYLNDARADAERALALAPDDPEIHVLLGEIATIAGDAATARRHAQAALAIDPAHPEALTLLGSAAEADGDIRGAGELYVRGGRMGDTAAAESLRKVGQPRLGGTEWAGVAGAAFLWVVVCGVAAAQLGLGAAQFLFFAGAAAGGVYLLVIAPRRRREALDDEARDIRRGLEEFPDDGA